MISPREEIEAFHYHLQGLNLQPGGMVALGRRVWRQERPLHCPCGVLFFGWQPDDAPMPPYTQPSNRMRIACGHPKCHEAEIVQDLARSRSYSAACRSYTESKGLKPVEKRQNKDLSSLREAV
jgi:hypothetical protein